MKRKSVYNYQFMGSESVLLSVGEHNLTFSFTWPAVIQDQVDIVEKRVTDMSTNDPLIGGEGMNRSYDYIDYYTSIPDFGAGMEEWWTEQTMIPSSLRNTSTSAVYSVLTSRKALCTQMKAYISELSEMLYWTAEVVDENNEVTVAPVIPGGWYRNQDEQYAFRFTSEMDNIGQDDLARTSLEVEVYSYE